MVRSPRHGQSTVHSAQFTAHSSQLTAHSSSQQFTAHSVPSNDTAKGTKKAELYATQSVSMTLGAKEKRTITIRSSFKPEKVVVDPGVRVLQLRRQSAEAKL